MVRGSNDDSRLVYSSDAGRVDYCPKCNRPKRQCVCRQATGQRGDGTVRVSRERQGRAGKTVTVVTGLTGDAARLAEIATQLKRLCGSGGAIKDGVVEIQGDHREKVAVRLKELGFRVKLAGG